jgi:hypothetical protein
MPGRNPTDESPGVETPLLQLGIRLCRTDRQSIICRTYLKISNEKVRADFS